MGQIIGYVVVLSLSLAVLLPIILYSQDKIIGTTQSLADITQQANLRASQNISHTYILADNTTEIHLSNVGLVDVTVFAVLIDGIEKPYTLENQQGNSTSIISPKQLAVLSIDGTGISYK